MLMEACILVDKINKIFINKLTKRNNMSEDISSKVKKIVADHLGIDESKVNDDSVLLMIRCR